MAATKTTASVDDWTAVAQNTIVEGTEIDVSSSYGSTLHIQAALDTTTAHTGTRFLVQTSGNTTGNEDWEDFVEFIGLIGTAATDLIEDNPLAAASTAIALTGHALTVLGKWLLIEDGTLVNSELVFEKSQTTNEVVILDGATNEHALNTAIFNVAFSKPITIPIEFVRARLIIDNSYDADGSTLNVKCRVTKVTAV